MKDKRIRFHRSGLGNGLTLSVGGGGVSYLLNDSFNDTDTAPLTSPRTASPGPQTGTITVTDSAGTNLETGSGKLRFLNRVSAADPKISYGSISNDVGTALIVKLTQPATSCYFSMYVSAFRGNFFYGGRVYNGTATLKYTDQYLVGTEHMFGLIKGNGCDYHMRNGYLLYKYPTTVSWAAPVLNVELPGAYPLLVDFVRIPTVKVTPRPLVADSFTLNQGVICITMDDLGNIDDCLELAELATERGLKVTMAVHLKWDDQAITAQDYANLQTLIDDGHDVICHSMTHPDLTNLDGMNIQYVGAGSACTMTINANTLTTSVTGGPGGENLSYDLTNYDLDSLKTAINALSAYTASYPVVGGYNFTAAVNLADVAGQDIRSSEYTSLLDATKYYDYEIAQPKALLEANLTAAGGGAFTCKGYAYPYGYNDAAVRAAVKASGYLGARLAGGTYMGLGNVTDIYQLASKLPEAEFGADIEGDVKTHLDTACASGKIVILLGHSFAGYYSKANWIRVLDAIKDYQDNVNPKLRAMTFTGILDEIIADGTTADNITYTWNLPISSRNNSDGGGLTGLEAGGTGKVWNAEIGTWAVNAAGKALCPTLDGGIGIATVDVGTSDVYFKAALTRSGDNVGIVVNYVDENNYVRAFHDGTNVSFQTVIGGTPANVFAPAAGAYGAGYELLIRSIGTSYFVYYNNVFIGSGEISNATLRSGEKCGLYTDNAANTFDNVQGYATRQTILDAFSY